MNTSTYYRYDQPEIVPPQSFVMKPNDVCDSCKEVLSSEVSINEIAISFNYGWQVCFPCLTESKAKSMILSFLNSKGMVPLNWLNPGLMGRTLDFFHSRTKTVLKGIFNLHSSQGSPFLVYSGDVVNYSIWLSYSSTASGKMGRYVSLGNVFKHNPKFFNDLVSSENLLGSSDVCIKWTDLPVATRQAIEEVWSQSQLVSSESFAY